MMYNIKLSKTQLQNLLVFLDRVELKGINEAKTLTEIVYHLKHQIELNEKESGSKENTPKKEK